MQRPVWITDLRETYNVIIVKTRVRTRPNRNLKRHRIRPICARKRPGLLPSVAAHLPRPSFSLSEKSLLPPMLNVGKLVESFLACLEKNPLFLVENDGYPLISSVRAAADCQVTPWLPADPFAVISPCVFRGLDLPLMLSYWLVSPGLDQPPPLLGEGDRDNDMMLGVPGIGGSG